MGGEGGNEGKGDLDDTGEMDKLLGVGSKWSVGAIYGVGSRFLGEVGRVTHANTTHTHTRTYTRMHAQWLGCW